MPAIRVAALTALGCALAGCNAVAPLRGTPEFAALQVSRGYDCGLRVERGRVIAALPAPDRQRFIAANARYAVSAYKAPRRCDDSERQTVQSELRALIGRR